MFSSESDLVSLPGAIHAVEHALIALLPLFAMCDRWDIGGLSTPVHSQTEQPTIFVYDGHAGGVGISRQGFERFGEWVRDARNLIRDCPCECGCPSCIQSPKCGNWNEPLDKEAALRLLGAMLEGDAIASPMKPRYVSVIGAGRCGRGRVRTGRGGRPVRRSSAEPRWSAEVSPGSWKPPPEARRRPGAPPSASCPGTIAARPTPTSITSITTGMGEARNLAVVSSGDVVIAVGGGLRHPLRDRPGGEDRPSGHHPVRLASRRRRAARRPLVRVLAAGGLRAHRQAARLCRQAGRPADGPRLTTRPALAGKGDSGTHPALPGEARTTAKAAHSCGIGGRCIVAGDRGDPLSSSLRGVRRDCGRHRFESQADSPSTSTAGGHRPSPASDSGTAGDAPRPSSTAAIFHDRRPTSTSTSSSTTLQTVHDHHACATTTTTHPTTSTTAPRGAANRS